MEKHNIVLEMFHEIAKHDQDRAIELLEKYMKAQEKEILSLNK